jgi:hypothetical protein
MVVQKLTLSKIAAVFVSVMALCGSAHAFGTDGECGKRICGVLKVDTGGAYIEFTDTEALIDPIISPIEGGGDELRYLLRGKNTSECDMTANAPSSNGATNGDVTSTSVTCTYKLPGGFYEVITTTFTWVYDSRTGQWTVIGVESKKHTVKYNNQEK